MSKVLVIGPKFYNFNAAVESAFLKCGCQVDLEQYDNPIHPYNIWMKCKYKLSSGKEKMKSESRAKYRIYIERRFDEIKPDLVFLLNGDILLSETLDFFRKSAKVALWLFDSISRYPIVTNHIDHVDYLFCYEQKDIEWYKRNGKKSYFLAQGCDSSIYKPLRNIRKDIDILFVGELYSSKKRQKYISKVIESFPNKKIKIFGIYKPWYKNPIKWIFREHRKIYINHNIDSQSVNNYYNRATVVINIHHEQQENGANPKVFEICGSGAYQVCDTNPYIESLFRNNEIGLYHNETEMIKKIEDALLSEKKEEAEKAYNIVIKDHTFNKRIESVLRTIQL